MQAPAKSANRSKFGPSMRARVQVSYASPAVFGRRRAARAPRPTAKNVGSSPSGALAARPLLSNVSSKRTRAIGVILIKNPLRASN